jgi:hypothetical protein
VQILPKERKMAQHDEVRKFIYRPLVLRVFGMGEHALEEPAILFSQV